VWRDLNARPLADSLTNAAICSRDSHSPNSSACCADWATGAGHVYQDLAC
jgi:hypothetical protein